MDPAYAKAYRELHERHWWWRVRREVVLRTLRGELTPSSASPGHPRRILDVGCGEGLFFDDLARFGEVHGVEMDPSLAEGNPRWSSRIHCGPFDEQFQPDTQFDAILLLDVLEHLPHPRAALQHARRLLAPTGFLLITVPAFRWLWTSHDDLNHHFTRYSSKSLRQLLRETGWAGSDLRYFFRWTVPAKLAVRFKERLFGGEGRPPRVPPEPVNRCLQRVTRWEERLGRRLPWWPGSSLLCVARPLPVKDAPLPREFHPAPLSEVISLDSPAETVS